jgi:signal peptidase I
LEQGTTKLLIASTIRVPTGEHKIIIKRIIGLPGDVVRVENNHWKFQYSFVYIPPGHCWLEGDNSVCQLAKQCIGKRIPSNQISNHFNQFVSIDSKRYGPIPLALVLGKVEYQIWPLNKFKPIANVDTSEKLVFSADLNIQKKVSTIKYCPSLHC